MPTKTTTVKEVAGKAEGKNADKVEPEVVDARLETATKPDNDEAAARREEAAREAKEAKAPAAKSAVNLNNLVAYSDFELLGKTYAAGDKFTVPEGWVHEPGFDTFRSAESKTLGRDLGMSFTVPGEIINKKTGERDYSRQVLPVKAG